MKKKNKRYKLTHVSNVHSWGDIWDAIQDVPVNTLVNTSYRAIDLSADAAYLKSVWQAFLAQRRCSTNLECINNNRGDECIYDELPPRRDWRNGDITDESSVGDEGGCLCDFSFALGFWAQFCDVCMSGMGPAGNCTFPVAFEEICGPGGSEYNATVIDSSVSMPILYLTNDNKQYTVIPSCRILRVEGSDFVLDEETPFVAYRDRSYLISYTLDETESVNIINDKVFTGNGTLVTDYYCRVNILDGDDAYFYDVTDYEQIQWGPFMAVLVDK